jgi:hypothetical protein
MQNAILQFGKLHLHKEIRSISKGGERLIISHRTKGLSPIVFKPDRIFTLQNRSKIAFQVLETQTSKYREIEADILRAYLCAGVSKLVFIVPTNFDLENVSRIAEIIQDGLENLGVERDTRLFMTLLIPKEVVDIESALVYLNNRKSINEIFNVR